jgi:hypothetical protein
MHRSIRKGKMMLSGELSYIDHGIPINRGFPCTYEYFFFEFKKFESFTV